MVMIGIRYLRVRRNLIHFGAQLTMCLSFFLVISFIVWFSKMVEEHLAHQAEVTVAAKPVSLTKRVVLGFCG